MTPSTPARGSAEMCRESSRQIGEDINKWMEMKALSQIMGGRERAGSAGEMKAGTGENNVGKGAANGGAVPLTRTGARVHPHN